ncbi:MAG: single-stranded DNA-binding protein [Acidimicrobiales bacterium]
MHAVGEDLAQGRQIAVSGRLDYSEWTDAEGARHSRREIVATSIDFLAPLRAAQP